MQQYLFLIISSYQVNCADCELHCQNIIEREFLYYYFLYSVQFLCTISSRIIGLQS